MINQYFICMCMSVTLASVSQVLLKRSTFNKYDLLIKEYINPWVICGYLFLGCSMLLTIYAYSGIDYKNGPVIESLGNVFVPILSYFAFKERISLRKLLGIICIMLGIIVFYV